MSLTATAVALMISLAAPAAVVETPTTTPTITPPAPVAPVDAEATAQPTMAAEEESPDIIVLRRKPAPPGDPLEKLNIQSFEKVQAVDKAVLEPVAKVYNKGLPKPVRQGLRNFFANLSEPVVFAAYLLEFKPGKAAETAGRFVINSTVGIGGVLDMAKRKPFHLPYRPNGLANVMGYYGVRPGPYMYLPIIGPTTLRDVIGDSVDRLLLPAAVGKPFDQPAFVIPSTILGQLGERAAFDAEIRNIREEDDPYAAYRTLYLNQRKAEIEALHGRVTPGIVPVYGPAMRTPGKNAEAEGASPSPAAPL